MVKRKVGMSEDKMIFSINDIAIEHNIRSGVKYCVRDGKLFKCLGGFRDFKCNQFIPKKAEVVNVACLQLSREVKELALSLGIPVVHNRNLRKYR